jgi:hypothetical protein
MDEAKRAVRSWLGAGGVGFWLDGEAGDHDGADCVFGDLGEMFGEDATISEFVNAVGTAEADDPTVVELLGVDRGDFGDRDDEARLQMGIEGPDIFGANQQANGDGDSVGHARLAAVDDD